MSQNDLAVLTSDRIKEGFLQENEWAFCRASHKEVAIITRWPYYWAGRKAWFHWTISIGNSRICSDIWHKYHKRYFEIVKCNLRQFWNITSGIYAKYHVQIMLLFVYTTTHKGFVIFTCRYFKLSWNTTALSQSNCRNFSCSSIIHVKPGIIILNFKIYQVIK